MTGPSRRVLLMSPEGELRSYLGDEGVVVRTLDEVLSHDNVDVIVVDGSAISNVPATLRALSAGMPGTEIILAVADLERLSPEDHRLLNSIGGSVVSYEQLSTHLRGLNPITVDVKRLLNVSTGGDFTALPARCVAVLGPKGGVGKTLMAVNLAFLVARSGMKTLLVDLDLAASDASVHLGLLEGPTILDMIPFVDDLPTMGFSKFVRSHPSGLDLVTGVPRPELAEMVEPSHVRSLLVAAFKYYSFIIVDTPAGATVDLTYESVEFCNYCLLVTTQDPCAVRQAGTALNTLLRMGIPSERFKVTVNRYADGGALPTAAAIGRFLGASVIGTVRQEPAAVGQALVRGIPVVGCTDDGITRDLKRIAEALCPGIKADETREPAFSILQLVRRLIR